MKNLKKALALLLALTMVLCLSACGSFEKKLAKSAAKMSQLKSMHMDMDVQMGVGISIMGQSMDMDMSIDAGIDMNMEPYAMKMDMDIKAMGVSQNVQVYVFDENGQRRSYATDDGGNTWIKGELEDIELKGGSVSAKDSLKIFTKWTESFEQAGEEKINGSAATKYSGEITAENMTEAIKLAGVKDQLKDKLGVEFDAQSNDIGNMPMSIWIDNKSGMVVRAEMDMTAMIQGIFTQILNEAISSSLEGSGLEGLPMEIEISNAVVTIGMSQFDKVSPIELPAGAK